MPGFDQNDPLSEGRFGYRADALRNGSIKSYNGFTFPPALRSRVTVVPEYSDDGITTKYLTIALSIEFILTDGTDDQTSDFSETSYISNTFVKSMCKRLTQPGQALYFTADVLGDFKVNAPGGISDVDYGPKPQVVEIEPLGGGNAARVEWLCVTRVSPCMTEFTRQSYVQYSYTTSWGLDSAGYMLRTVEGAFELPSSRGPVVGGEHASTQLFNPIQQITDTKKYLLTQFPLLKGFRRTYFYKLKNNRKSFEFKIEDTEIRSDNIFPPGISDIELVQSITSSLQEGGFLVWKLTYSGRLETVNSKNVSDNFYAKKLAFYWLGVIIREKRKKFEQVLAANTTSMGSKQQFDNQTKPPTWPEIAFEQVSNPIGGVSGAINELSQPQTEKNEYLIYPTHISISDSLYSNTISFTLSYNAVVSTSLLAKATGLFEKLDIPGIDDSTWVKYLEEAQVYVEGVQLMPNYHPVVDLCHDLTGGPGASKESDKVGGSSIGEGFTEVSYNETASNWVEYYNRFEYYTDNGTLVGTTLATDVVKTQDQMAPLNSPSDIAGEQLKNPIDGAPTSAGDLNQRKAEIAIFAPTKNVAYIKMVGKAARISSPISAPTLIGVGEGVTVDKLGQPALKVEKGGALAHKYGTDKVHQNTRKTGMNKQGKPVYVYVTSWEKTYVLDRIPTTGKITTSGVPGRFN